MPRSVWITTVGKLSLPMVWFLCAVILLMPMAITSATADVRQDLKTADSLLTTGETDAAIAVLEKTLTAIESAGGGDSLTAVITLALGRSLTHNAQYARADSMLDRSLNARLSHSGERHLFYADALKALSELRMVQGRKEEGVELCHRYLDLLEALLGETHPDFMSALNDVSLHFEVQCLFPEAEAGYLRTKAIQEQTIGTGHSDYAETLNWLSIVNWYLGNLIAAEQYARQAATIWTGLYGDSHPLVAKALNNVGISLIGQNRKAEAAEFLERALLICREVAPDDHEKILAISGNLAIIYQDRGDIDRALRINREVLDLKEKIYGPDHSTLSPTLINLASNYELLGDLSRAKDLFGRQLRLKEAIHGRIHPALVYGLQGLARVLTKEGRLDEAAPLFTRLFEIDSIFYGGRHNLYAEHLGTYGLYLRRAGRTDDAIVALHRSYEVRKRNFNENILVLAEEDALAYSRLLRSSAHRLVAALLETQPVDTAYLRLIGDVVLSTKGAVSDGIFARRQLLSGCRDSAMTVLLADYKDVRSCLAAQYVRTRVTARPLPESDGLDSLTALADSLERALALRSKDFRTQQQVAAVSVGTVAPLVPERTVLVEYVRYTRALAFEKDSSDRYLAVAISREGIEVIEDLGPAAVIDTAVATCLDHMDSVSRHWPSISAALDSRADEIFRNLYRIIWQPLAVAAADRECVLVSPDGELNLLPFHAFLSPEGDYLVEKYPIHQLSAGRDLIRLGQFDRPGAGLLAIGDPDFNSPVNASVSSVPGPPDASSSPVSGNDNLRSVRFRSYRELGRVTGLPYTRREIKRVAGLWKDRGGEEALVLLGTDATEGNFKRLAPGRLAIHLATHGFIALPDDQPRGPVRDQSPLLQVGLLFAGANLSHREAEDFDRDDGILTAYEVAAMNLEGTRWVVLSACESGLGRIRAGEGVYGLSRAFQMAGVSTVICSLWPVPDKETARVMAGLYESHHEDLALTMRRMAIDRLAGLRADGSSDHPFAWAAFIARGGRQGLQPDNK